MFHHHNEEILSLAREIAQQKRFLTPEHRMIIDSEKEKEKQLLAEAQAKIEEDKEKRKARNSPKPPATKETIDEDLANYTGVATHQSRQAAKDLVSSGITKNIEDEALRLPIDLALASSLPNLRLTDAQSSLSQITPTRAKGSEGQERGGH